MRAEPVDIAPLPLGILGIERRAVVVPGVCIRLVGFDQEEEEKRNERGAKTEYQPSIEMQERHYPHTL